MELAADLTPEGLRDVLAELAEQVAPTSLARERILPVHPALFSLFPEGGLVRGRVHACVGSGATSTAMTLACEPAHDGAWVAVVDVMTFGPDAATELGLPLERLVRIDASPTASAGSDESTSDGSADRFDPAERMAEHVRRWVDVMAAAIDGFDVVVAAVPAGVRGARLPASVRTLLARLQQRGSVLVLLGSTGAVPVDVTIASRGDWAGLGAGHGVINGRRLELVASGRRQPRPSSCSIDCTAVGRRLRIVPAAPRPPVLVSVGAPTEAATAVASTVDASTAIADVDDEVLAEMVAHVAHDDPVSSPELRPGSGDASIRLAAG